ncbi:hypothetical protein [Tropicibacter naphthalenivorans]|uniref:NADH dehydrogenase subunit E n=1 Tax=Tropicibacter naphthalenivorans TaxID=441103 RepID=A0A0P1GW63_9RHOB|nr:hypothetical protein [Tropicibacter naphthalenivorans]CUH80283.1 hypothetical protein TRN7648_02910 [Tropicibacter naphthalenivorans]SMC85731.1 hypothetical protein SAMN04488093_105179 [Tropicibacter naphthalenivorans]
MKKIAFACAALGMTAACVMPPKDVTQQDLEQFDAAVASIGCDLVGESDYLPVELQTGLTREKLLEVASYKVSTDEAVSLENGGVRLVTGVCTPKEV